MIYKCKIFDSQVQDVILWYTLNYPSIFNRKGYADLKHKLNNFTTKYQTCKWALVVSFFCLLVSLNICAHNYDTILTLLIE